ncbi:MAG: hypothetical protein ABIH25_02900 [Candidatus Woesearchaeota archaeon]
MRQLFNIDSEVKLYLYGCVGAIIATAILTAYNFFAEPEIRRAIIYETSSGNNVLHLDKFGRDGELYEDSLNSGKYVKLKDKARKNE